MIDHRIQEEELFYDSILVNWEKSKPDFMLWIEWVCGIQANSDLYMLINRLIKGEPDLVEWISLFDGDLDHIEQTTVIFKTKCGERV